jgi:hypothetical protein
MWVKTETRGEHVAFLLGNEGPTISREDAARIFDAFFTRKENGTGLGLAIAQHLVHLHGGTIWCDPLPHGVEFGFTLPAASASTDPDALLAPLLASLRESLPRRIGHGPSADPTDTLVRPRSASSSPSGPSPLVALVDDSRAFLPAWRKTLDGQADVLYFASPAAFFAATEKDRLLDRLDVVVTDYRFGTTSASGADFAREVRRRRRDVPIFLSSSALPTAGELGGTIDVALGKMPVTWERMQALSREARGTAKGSLPLRADDADHAA